MSNYFYTNLGRTHTKKHLAEKKIFEPFVSVEQVTAYDPKDPATHTESRLMNAVLEAIHVVKPLKSMAISEYLGLDNEKLTYAVEIITGMNLSSLIDVVREVWLEKLRKEHPLWSNDELVQAIGMFDRSSLWRFEQKMNKKSKK